MDLVSLKSELEESLTEYTYRIGKRIYGECIICRKSNFSGADIFLKDGTIVVEASIPEMKYRLLIGSGAVYLKKFKKDYSEPSNRIFQLLGSKNYKVKLKK